MWYGLCCNCHIDVILITICKFIFDEGSKKIWLHLQKVKVLQHSKSYKIHKKIPNGKYSCLIGYYLWDPKLKRTNARWNQIWQNQIFDSTLPQILIVLSLVYYSTFLGSTFRSWIVIYFSKFVLGLKVIIYEKLAKQICSFFDKFFGLWTFNIMKIFTTNFFFLKTRRNNVPPNYKIEKCCHYWIFTLH